MKDPEPFDRSDSTRFNHMGAGNSVRCRIKANNPPGRRNPYAGVRLLFVSIFQLVVPIRFFYDI